MTKVMRSHGLRQNDIFNLEELPEAEVAYAGDKTKLTAFWLYDWSESDGGAFIVIRQPAQ